jgi:hypothetical protein
MATTISNAELTITVSEDIKLNGQQVGSKTIQTISGINEASRRIFSVPTYETEILALSSSAGAGTYTTTDLQYIRLSNLDDTNFVRISFVSASVDTPATSNRYDMKLPAKRTAIFTSPSISGSAGGDSFNAFVDFQSMKAIADTDTVDIELFVASI